MFNNIGHVAFQTAKTNEMLKFYQEILGLPILFQTTYQEFLTKLESVYKISPNSTLEAKIEKLKPKAKEVWVTYLRLSYHQYLELFTKDEEYRDAEVLTHFQYLVIYVNNFARIINKLVANHINYKSEANSIVLADPDGNNLLLKEAPQGTLTYPLNINYLTNNLTEMTNFYAKLGKVLTNNSFELAPLETISLTETKEKLTNNKKLVGYKHLCLEVKNIKEIYQQLKELGIKPDSSINYGVDKSFQFWIHDPDLNDIEIMEYTPLAKQNLDKTNFS